MKLILDIPITLIRTFQKYSDGEMVLINYLSAPDYAKHYSTRTPEKERWLGYIVGSGLPKVENHTLIEAIYIVNPDFVIATQSYNSRKNIIQLEKLKSELDKRDLKVKIIGVWGGTLWEIPIITSMVYMIGLPHTLYRGLVEKEMSLSETHFLGYKYKEELVKGNPVSINTSVPIRAASIGISLRERMRRPKGLPSFNQNQSITFKEQIALTIDNINFIKEVGDGKNSNDRGEV